MKKQKPRDAGQGEDKNPKPKAGRHACDDVDHDSLKEKLKRTEIEDEADEEKKPDEPEKREDETIVNKSDNPANEKENIGGKGKSKIVNKEN